MTGRVETGVAGSSSDRDLFANERCGLHLMCIYIYIYMFNRSWVDTRWQQYSTHLHTNSTHNTQNGTYITIKQLKKGNNKELANLC
jgi:hypothetical protein